MDRFRTWATIAAYLGKHSAEKPSGDVAEELDEFRLAVIRADAERMFEKSELPNNFTYEFAEVKKLGEAIGLEVTLDTTRKIRVRAGSFYATF